MPEFETLYHEYFRFVWCAVRRLGVPESGVDDAVQEVFLVIHAKLDTVQKPDSLRSWIYGIARRVASQHRRGSARLTTSDELATANLPSARPSPLELTEHAADLALVSSILGELSDAKREIFLLVEFEEMPVPEVAAALEIPLNTAYSRLRHARLEFEETLARRLAPENRKGHV